MTFQHVSDMMRLKNCLLKKAIDDKTQMNKYYFILLQTQQLDIATVWLQ